MRQEASAVLFAALVGSILGPGSGRTATFTVDREDDVSPIADACTGAANDCSLRGAVAAANGNAGADTILVPPGTYTLSRAGNGEDFNQTGDLDIRDSGADLVIDGDDLAPPTIVQSTDDRIFDVASFAGAVTFRDLLLTGGDSPDDGGAIDSFRNESLTVERVVFVSNHAAQFGGCLSRGDSSTGNATIADSVFQNCTADGDGGAMRFDVSPSPFQDAITGCRFVDNSAPKGGAINLGPGSFVRIEDSVFVGNQAMDPVASAGGTIYVAGAGVLLNRVSIVDSVAGPVSNANSFGGAVYMTRTGSDRPSVEMVNVTISRSSAVSQFARGAAIYLSEGDLDLFHVTIDESRTGGQHSIFVGGPNGPPAATVDFDSSIIDGGCATLFTVSLASGAFNVEKPWDGTTTSTCGLAGATGDVVTQADLLLRPPAVYGGPAGVETQEVLPGSPAGGLVASTDCAPEDARTAPRTLLFCAAGAHEPSGTAPGPWIFADTFDSGDTGAWSLTMF